MSAFAPGTGNPLDGPNAGERERGYKRKKLAGYLKAANDIRQSYAQSYSERWGANNFVDDDDTLGIPGAFPDVTIVSHGDEQLILFPSYACRHRRVPPDPSAAQRPDHSSDDEEIQAEFLAREWQKYEDDRAIVDVDVRGWMYSPHRGALTRKHRLLIGLARQLSGIPAPRTSGEAGSRTGSPDGLRARHKQHEAEREEQSIAREAEKIMRKGDGERKVAATGGYSEEPKSADSDNDSIYSEHGDTRDGMPSPGSLPKRGSWAQPANMSAEELAIANKHLMARLKPFMTNPLVSMPITLFFYNEKQSISRTIVTNESGHFIMRAALDFVPTHVRVLASEHLSATEPVQITEPRGVSLITDVDDTIKHSCIGSGAREIFRNAFIRELQDLTIDGVREWYNTMFDMGVRFHYVSNSPWQIFPVMASFFAKAGLPPGSYHLKQYSGMLQGIFEPVAERKKGTLDRIMRDFPDRRFILVGDSGEADLEVYTEVVQANPGKIIAVFIRDVTMPKTQGFFDSAMGPLSGEPRRDDRPFRVVPEHEQRPSNAPVEEIRPILPPRHNTDVKAQTSDGPAMGTLIDFASDPETPAPLHVSHQRVLPRSNSDAPLASTTNHKASNANDEKGLDPSRGPPPRPRKPVALRGQTMNAPTATDTSEIPDLPPNPRPRVVSAGGKTTVNDTIHPLSQSQSITELKSPPQSNTYMGMARAKAAAAYDALPEIRSRLPYGPPALPTRPKTANAGQPAPGPDHKPQAPRRSVALSNAPADKYHRAYGRPNSDSSSTSSNSSPSTSDDEPSKHQRSDRRSSRVTNAFAGGDTPPAPSGLYHVPSTTSTTSATATAATVAAGGAPNKKIELWRRRWIRAKDILESQGVMLRAWRVGEDVAVEACRAVDKALREMDGKSRGPAGVADGKGSR